MSIVYLDSSVALRTILDVPERVRLQTWMDAEGTDFVSSRLLRTEVVRVLRRDSRPIADARPLFSRVGLFDITRETYAVAESIERHIKTLDALHLATALLIGESVTIASHDSQLTDAAVHLGLSTVDPSSRPEPTEMTTSTLKRKYSQPSCESPPHAASLPCCLAV